MVNAVAYGTPISPLSSEGSTTLTVSAGVVHEIFADALEIPRWRPSVQGERTLACTPDGRPQRVAFTRTLERGSLEYTLGVPLRPGELHRRVDDAGDV